MWDRQRDAVIKSTPKLRGDLAVHATPLENQFPLDAFLVVDRAERTLDVGVVETDLAGDESRKVGLDVLGIRQCVDLVVIRSVENQFQYSWFVVKEFPVVAQVGRIALSAALGGAEKVVEIRAVPRQTSSPELVAAGDIHMATLFGRQAVARCVSRGDAQARELERIVEVEVIADPCIVLVTLQHRKGV